MYIRTSHPNLHNYDVVVLDTKVHHELLVSKELSDDDIIQLVIDYLLTYESTYPNTESHDVWVELISKLPGEVIE